MLIERSAEATNFTCLLVIMPLANTAKDRVVKMKAMNLPASNLTSKQDRLGHAEESKFDICNNSPVSYERIRRT